mmetsp:Transcript_10357/g.31186  ORF Transcript_10357/g.31186 Transcript_10357/m.31186 type:complete len:505 (-) Transcript_10357:553-2067(-)|eukprot:CAMPEP_0206140374 /NCGR_PEP_ID=MMETSP1473-20131121/9229_1 /ASSEMBLY_ACC=CAM_ASM_001109 /TAXON_ID=1461547 /ORGANISM="Stichococcus sp, Strain RCC1054" /LENGTH=504 /DNA_ID=CAMNT_0053534499 /DNA_START=129 /DNA_END=1643 /DNA_ORIENTATION=+
MAEIIAVSVVGQISVSSAISGLVALVQGFYRISEIKDMRRDMPHMVAEVDTLLRLLQGMKDTAKYADHIARIAPENAKILKYVDSVIQNVEKKLEKAHKKRFWWYPNVPASTAYLAELRHRLERAMDTYVGITCLMELRNGQRENKILFDKLKGDVGSHWKHRHEVAYDSPLLDSQPSAPPYPESPNPDVLRTAASAPADVNMLSSIDASIEEKYDFSPSKGLVELECIQLQINEALDNGLGASEVAHIIDLSEQQTNTSSRRSLSPVTPPQQPPVPILQRSHTDGLTLYEACANGNLSAVKQLLQDQPECTMQWLERNNHPLHAAAEHNHHLVVNEMLEHIFKNCAGDELELVLRAYREGDQDNKAWTALHEAAFSADGQATVEVFLDLASKYLSPARFCAFVNDHSNPHHYSSLHCACESGNYKVAGDLLKAGANASAPDKRLATPLHIAAHFGHTSVVKTLLEHDYATIEATDYSGQTPISRAKSAGAQRVEVLEMLQQYA